MSTTMPAPRCRPTHTPRTLSPSDYLASAQETGHDVPSVRTCADARRAARSSDALAIVAAVRLAAHGGAARRPWTPGTRDAIVRAGLANPACPQQVALFAATYWR